jgi:hypothetical protein
MLLTPDDRILSALRILFGPTPQPTRVDRRAIRSCFRRRAHDLHPDKARQLGVSSSILAHRFRELRHAYDYLNRVLDPHAELRLSPFCRTAATENRERSGGRPRPVPSPAAGAWQAWRPGPQSGTLLPARRLRFAQYLYYSRVIDWPTMFAAMRWQGRKRPRVGEIARDLSYLSRPDIADILCHRSLEERFGETALRLGRLSHVRLFTVLGRQRRLNLPIGRFFVEHHILTADELALHLEGHLQHNLSCAAAQLRERLRRTGRR